MSISLGKNFWLFRSGQIVSLVGDQLGFIAVSFYILTQTSTGIKMSFVLIPARCVGLALLLFLGPLADRFKRKSFILWGGIINAISWLGILFFLLQHHLSLVVLSSLYLCNAIGSSMSSAGSAGFLIEIVSKEKIQVAYQTITGTNSVTKILSGFFAGAIVSFFGIPLSVLINAISFLFISINTLMIFPNTKRPIEKKKSKREVLLNWKKDFVQGVQYTFHIKPLRYICLSLFFIQFIMVSLQIALPFFVKNYLHESASFLGLLLSAEGTGAIVVSIFLQKCSLKIKNNNLFLFSLMLTSLSLIFLGVFPMKGSSFLFLIICSAGLTAANIIFNTTLLKRVPENYLSRTFTIILFLEGIAAPLGLFCAGYGIDWLGIRNIFMAAGLSLSGLIVLMYYLNAFDFLVSDQALRNKK